MQRTDEIDKIFANFTNDDFWKIIIDGSVWRNKDGSTKANIGPYIFDKDESPGYLKSVGTALYLMLATIDMPLQLPYIIALHDLAYHKKDKGDGPENALGLKVTGIAGISIINENENFTSTSLIDLIKKIRNENIKLQFFYTKKAATTGERDSQHFYNITETNHKDKSPEQIATELRTIEQAPDTTFFGLGRYTSIQDVWEVSEKYLQRLNDEILQANGDKQEILKAIVHYIQDMHQYHPFKDGNGRLFIFLLLNKLLIQHKLDPTLIEVPDRFTGYDLNSLVKEVKNGQAIFRAMTQTPQHKTTPFMDYLRNKFQLNVTLKKEIFAKMDIQQAFQDPETKEYIQNNIENLICDHFCGIFDKKIIDFITPLIPKTANYLKILNSCLETDNQYLMESIIANMPQETMCEKDSEKTPLLEKIETIRQQLAKKTSASESGFFAKRNSGDEARGTKNPLYVDEDHFDEDTGEKVKHRKLN